MVTSWFFHETMTSYYVTVLIDVIKHKSLIMDATILKHYFYCCHGDILLPLLFLESRFKNISWKLITKKVADKKRTFCKKNPKVSVCCYFDVCCWFNNFESLHVSTSHMRSGTIFSLAYSLTHLFHQSGRVRVVVMVRGCLCHVRISSASFWPKTELK